MKIILFLEALMETHNPLKATILVTVIAVNLMLGSLLISRKIIRIGGVTPVIAVGSENTSRIDFVTKFMGSKNYNETSSNLTTGSDGIWTVEHYKEYEIHYNNQGKIIFRQPTGKEDNIRYWRDKKS